MAEEKVSSTKVDSQLKATPSSDIKSWLHRIKFDTPFMIIFFVLYAIYSIMGVFVLIGIDLWLKSSRYINGLFVIGIFLFSVSYGKKVPQSFYKMITSNEKIFESKKMHDDYIIYLKRAYDSKIEFFIPLIIALLTFMVLFGGNVLNNFFAFFGFC